MVFGSSRSISKGLILPVGRVSHKCKIAHIMFLYKTQVNPKTTYDFNLDVGYSVSSFVYSVQKIFYEIHMVLEGLMCSYLGSFI